MYSTNNYSIKKELVFFPLNKLDQASISLNNNRLTSIKKKCGYCDSETCYDCSQCDAGISETYITVPNILFKKLPLIEKQISSQYSQALNSITKKEILDQIEKNHQVDLPQNLIDQEISIMTKNLFKKLYVIKNLAIVNLKD